MGEFMPLFYIYIYIYVYTLYDMLRTLGILRN